jgi:transcriptional regulator with XRE-family HTH domain
MINMAMTNVDRIPDADLAEYWSSFKHQILEKLQTTFRTRGMRQDEIGARIGKDPATISRALRGRRDMNLRTMHDLARGMGCRLHVELEPLDTLRHKNRQPLREEPRSNETTTTNNTIIAHAEPIDG